MIAMDTQRMVRVRVASAKYLAVERMWSMT